MTKRFTPKASRYVTDLAAVQAEMASLRKQLRELEAKEASYKAYLFPFFEQGVYTVTDASGEFEVAYSTTERTVLNQDKARALIARLGKRVPETIIPVVSLKAKAI